ncbi:MAG: restriction endonuclease [Microcystaceae cyanobacterium]
MSAPIQKILFGSPATGKSYKIRDIAQSELDIAFDEQSKILKNTVKTVFHPEYTYADFMGKLLPLTQGNSVIYKYYSGHFLRVLGMAYRGLIDGNGENYLLIIDELNRGNAAAIFGTVFQLLDRESDGWSTYEVDISEMELIGLLNSMDYKAGVSQHGYVEVFTDNNLRPDSIDEFCDKINNQDRDCIVRFLLKNGKIKIPSNLSIIATINTSDESIYYLDTAFKRRWDWEYIDSPSEMIDFNDIPEVIRESKIKLDNKDLNWYKCVIGLNEFIKSHHQTIRRIEDKQIGWWFIQPENGEIPLQKVRDKLMFYLWDSVFTRDKRPLENVLSKKLNEDIKLVTYADFVKHTEIFISKMTEDGNLLLFNPLIKVQVL